MHEDRRVLVRWQGAVRLRTRVRCMCAARLRNPWLRSSHGTPCSKLPSLELDGGRDHRGPAGRADALRVGTEAGPVPKSHGNSVDSNLDTFVHTHPGQSGRRGQGVSKHRAEIGPPPVEAETFTSAYLPPPASARFDLVGRSRAGCPLSCLRLMQAELFWVGTWAHDEQIPTPYFSRSGRHPPVWGFACGGRRRPEARLNR